MNRFYFFIWLQWAVKVTLYTLLLSLGLTAIITFGIYIAQGMKPVNDEIYAALLAVFKFWFMLSLSFSLLIILFRSLKYIFNKCVAGYEFQLLTCIEKEEQEREVIKMIGYGDLLKVWRKWFMLIIWIVAVEMILALVIMKLLSSYENIFDWFNIYLLYIFILIAGYFSFIVLSMKCKKVRINRC